MEKLNANLHISNDSLKEYQKELYAKILNDDDFHILVEEGYTNQEIFDNVMKFSEYLSDIKKARKIRTYEDCLKANMTQRLILVRNGKIIERDYVPLEPYLKHCEYLSSFLERDFDEELSKVSIKEINQTALKVIYTYIKEGKWGFINGPLRSGRTYAAIAIVNHSFANEKYAPIAFLNTPVRIKELNDLYFKNKSEFSETLEAYSNMSVVVFDDFGSEYKNELIRDNIIIPILKNRAKQNKITIFTSDFSVKEIQQLYSFSRSGNDIMANQLRAILDSKIEKTIPINKVSLY